MTISDDIKPLVYNNFDNLITFVKNFTLDHGFSLNPNLQVFITETTKCLSFNGLGIFCMVTSLLSKIPDPF